MGNRATRASNTEPRSNPFGDVIALGSMLGLLFSAVYLNESHVAPLGLATLIPTLSTVDPPTMADDFRICP